MTADEMRAIDAASINDYGIPGAVLMERAGLAVAEKITELFPDGRIVVFCAGGNNGGDGMVAARALSDKGRNVKAIILAGENEMSADCRMQFRILKKMGIPLEFRKKAAHKDVAGAILVDALLGTGLSRDVKGPLKNVIEVLNRSGMPVVSVDIPSGISSDSGRIMGTAVRADYTVTFGLPKVGHLLHPGAAYTGRLFIEDIGFPPGLLASDTLQVQSMEAGDAALLIPERPSYSYKGDYGHVFVVAGSRGRTGAALMTAASCLKSGAGLVTIGVPESLADVFQGRVREEMILPLPDSGAGTLSEKAYEEIMEFLRGNADVLAIGPGLSMDRSTLLLVRTVLESVTVPVVIDADALNAVSENVGILGHLKAPCVLTPHPGEMARLLNGLALRNRASDQVASPAEVRRHIEENRLSTTAEFAVKTGACLLLKGAPTIISDHEGNTFINSTGNPGMATAGSGDVLTGIIAAFLAQGLSSVNAAVLGAFLHGAAGDIAAAQKGMHSLIASDIIGCLPDAFLSLRAS